MRWVYSIKGRSLHNEPFPSVTLSSKGAILRARDLSDGVRMLAVKARQPKFKAPEFLWRLAWPHMPLNLVSQSRDRQTLGTCWRQSNWKAEQASGSVRDTILKIRWRKREEDVWCHPLASACRILSVCTCTYMCTLHTHTHSHTKISHEKKFPWPINNTVCKLYYGVRVCDFPPPTIWDSQCSRLWWHYFII